MKGTGINIRRVLRQLRAGGLGALAGMALTPGAAVESTLVGDFPRQSIHISAPPTFAIANHGYRHNLNASYYSLLDVIGPEPAQYDYDYSLLSEVDGLTISDKGIVEFLPARSRIGESYLVDVEVAATRDGEVVFRDTLSFQTQVAAEVPQLTVFGLSGQGFGTFGNARTRYDLGLNMPLAEADWKFLRFSLIDPPAGVFLTSPNGAPALGYPLPEFGEGRTELPLRVRYELDTMAGVVSDEIEFVQELLPEPPPTGILELWNRVGSGAEAYFGFALARNDEWLAAGEPFIGDTELDAPVGAVHLWRVDSDTGQLLNEAKLTPDEGSPGEAFGASVAIRAATDHLPPALVVGAPEAAGGAEGLVPNAGRVDVFERHDDGAWIPVAHLVPPVAGSGHYFGGWVAISGDTIIASVEGADQAGPFSGALAVYRRPTATSAWAWAQTLVAPDAGEGDYFSYPCDLEGDWIAAAANEDDEAGMNAGAVHLFQRQAGGFVHRQKILSPEPQAGALFGERLQLAGEWLFISAFRQDNSTGAVYVYRRLEEVWTYQQRLDAPFVSEYSGFGSALAVQGETLTVSAPGHLGGPDDYPWKGITLYRCIDGIWTWANHRPGENFYRSDGFGFALAQISSHHTVTSLPFSDLNQGRSQGGRIVRFDWPELSPQGFESAAAELGGVTAEGDQDGNGIPNLIQWAMGHDIAQSPWAWRKYPATRQPFVEIDQCQLRLVIPPITRGWERTIAVLISTDAVNWTKATGLRWEAIRSYTFSQGEDAGAYLSPMQPIAIPWPENSKVLLMRLRIE